MPSITDYIQAGCAIATVLLAIVVYYQSLKVKTLSDVVIQMAKQTNVLSNQYQLQDELTRKEREPLFLLVSKTVELSAGNRYFFTLKNLGQAAHQIRFLQENNIIIESSFTSASPNNQDLTVHFQFDKQNKYFDLVMIYLDDMDNRFIHTIFCREGYLRLDKRHELPYTKEELKNFYMAEVFTHDQQFGTELAQ